MHQLLVKIYPNNYKLIYAAQLMTVGSKFNNRSNNKLYGWIRKKFIESLKDKTPWNKGKTHSEETKIKMRIAAENRIVTDEQRIKISNTMKGKHSGENNPFYGKTHSEETKQKISELNKGENNPMYGKTFTETHKKNISIGLKNKEKITCPHCGKEGDSGNMKRWHFDNCKYKEKL